MPSRDYLPHRANHLWAAVLLFVLSACGLETKHEPNLRVVGPPALVRPASAGTTATSSTIKIEIGDRIKIVVDNWEAIEILDFRTSRIEVRFQSASATPTKRRCRC